MIRDICSLNINGRCFSKNVNLPLFADNKSRFVLIYGRNGSGKTTISEGISKITKSNSDVDISVEALDANNKIIENLANDNIFVFNEKYIENNIKLADDGLQTILLVGKQVDLRTKIEYYKQQLESFENEYSKNNDELKKYDDINNKVCPKKYQKNIIELLQKDKGWAQTDSSIKRNIVKSKVTDIIINEIGELSVTETIDELNKVFNEQNELYDKIVIDASPCNIEIHNIKFNNETEQTILNALALKIKKPELSGREKTILETINKINFIDSAKNTFSKDDIHICPYCFQPINDEYKHQIIDEINNVLNKDVNDHRLYLSDCKNMLPDLEFNYEAYKHIDNKIVNDIYIQINKCNKIVDIYLQELDKKDKNCYETITMDNANLANEILNLNNLLSNLENKRISFNNAIKTKHKIKEELLLINKKIAHINIKTDYVNYINYSAQKQSLKTKCSEIKQHIDLVKMKITDLEKQSSDIGLAIDTINNALNYIFFSPSRFSVELKKDKYYLKSNGQNVLPQNISIGERNIIALCYFFTQIMANKDAESFYKDENFVIIDDPVSSFDFENKVGIISYLRYQINYITSRNPYSKILILSHDLETIYNLEKVGKEISKNNIKVKQFKLENRNIVPYPDHVPSEYGELLQKIYNYASETTDNCLEIGNVMRRVLEAFSTFVYKEGIEQVSLNTDILETLGKHSKFFENLMYRLVLHGESHYQEQVKSMHDGCNFYKFISDDEKKKTAQQLICFLYLLNKIHLKAYLVNNKSNDFKCIEEQIQIWLNDIPTNDHM